MRINLVGEKSVCRRTSSMFMSGRACVRDVPPLGMSQTKLATAVGLTFQQIQKYERGSNRMGSSRLFEFSKVLDVPVSHFFDEMPANALARPSTSGSGRKGFWRDRYAA